MTAPVRKRRDRSRRREVAPETIDAAKLSFAGVPTTGTMGQRLEPLTRADCVLIRQAVRHGWDTLPEKRVEVVQRLRWALNSEDVRLAISAAETILLMSETDQQAE